MKTRKMKTLVWSAAAMTVILLATACSGGGNNDANGSASPAAASQSATPATSPAAATESASPSASASGAEETKTATGDYVGLSDGHSIEIKVDGKSTTFQIDPETVDKVSTWEDGTKVKFQYLEQDMDANGEKVKQLTITAIDKV